MNANRKPPEVVAREYLRVSVDRSGQARSTDEQHAENQAAAESLDWSLGEPYRDDGRSASRYARKAREDFGRLIEDLERDRFGAGVLMLWESSRGSRKVGEWVRLIDLCEQRGVLIHVTTHNRTYDPANGRDRRSLLEDSVDSEYESHKTSLRARRTMAANAAEGRPHGPVPYGYRRVYDQRTGRLLAQEPEPAEAAVIRELFDRIVKGHSLRAIAADFASRSVRSRTGKVFTAQYLRSFLVNPAYAGQRLHVPGRQHSNTASAIKAENVHVVDAQWEPLVPRATFLAVQRIVSAPDRRTNRPGRGVHLLSMIARCDPCGRPLAAATPKKSGHQRAYRCHGKGCVQVDQAALDDYAEAVMLGYLARPDVYEALSRRDTDDVELGVARDEVASIRAELDDLADQVGRGELSATLAGRAEPGITARLKAAEAREAELSTPSVLRGLITPGSDVRRRWKAAPMSTKRSIARILLSPEILGELRVTRSPKPGRPVPVAERVVWRRSSA